MRVEPNWKPERLDIEAFAKLAGELSGEWSAAQLPRWAQSSDREPAPVRWALRGERRERLGATPEIWLHLRAQGEAHLVCQRCLQVDRWPIAVEQAFRFVRDETTALAQDPDSEEDLLVLSRSFDARELVEDELLLALPIVPMHEHCAPPALGAEAPAEVAPERPHPFAALAALREKK